MTPIEHGKYYHIYNRGNNYENIFRQKSDYLHFLELLDIFITTVADVYAWTLLGNHFHLLVRIKEEDEIGFLNSKYAKSGELDLKWKTEFVEDLLSSDEGSLSNVGQNTLYTRKPEPAQQFKHLFNAYSKWFNQKYERKGSLFVKNYKRIWVDNEKYLKNLILYIHQNPIHHKFARNIIEYPWTSYLTLVSIKPTKLNRDSVLGYFDDKANFAFLHQQEHDFEDISELIIE